MAQDYDASARNGLGMQVIKLLAHKLGGSLILPNAGDAAIFTVKVPVADNQELN